MLEAEAPCAAGSRGSAFEQRRTLMPQRPAYIIAARRTALGRIGGLHRARRVQDLAAPVIEACLKDCGLSPARIERLIVGNASETGNPARLIGLTAGLAEQVPAFTLDMQCAAGLAAIVDAARLVAAGEADAVIAGGAEALSMAPWQIAKPRALHQTPRIAGFSSAAEEADDGHALEADEAMAVNLKISRNQQDDFALRSHLKAGVAVDGRRFVKEIVALKPTAEEARDQSAVEPDLQDLQEAPPLFGDGSLTPALVGISWIGFDQPRTLGRSETGGAVALPIWIGYMEKALKGVPEVARAAPEGVVHFKVDSEGSGGHQEFFYKESLPPPPSDRAPERSPERGLDRAPPPPPGETPAFKPAPSVGRLEERMPPPPERLVPGG